jgi:uncharacterized protein
LPETSWTRLYLDAATMRLKTSAPEQASRSSYAALSEGITFSTDPLPQDMEIAGPLKARLWVESSTEDMDVFATLRAFDPSGKEVTFLSATEPKCPVSQGWLRISQRKLDPARSTEWRPFHAHDEVQPLQPGEIYPIDVEIWPASVFLPRGFTLALTLQGKDFERAGEPGPNKGVGWFTHDDPLDRPPAIFAGTNTIHTGPERSSFLLLPVISPG